MGSMAMAVKKVLFAVVALVACGQTWARARQGINPASGPIGLLPGGVENPVDSVVARMRRAAQEATAVHYQQFLKERGGGKKKERPEVARSDNSNYVSFKVRKSDGSVISLPIIKG